MTHHATAATATKGAHHIGLTVPDLKRAKAFFTDTLGYTQVGEKPDYPAVFLSDGSLMVTLWQVQNPSGAVPFDRKHVIGLHQLALRVDGEGALATLHERLVAADDVEIEFAPEPLGDGPTTHMMCYMPGGIRIEFIAPAA